jgi:fibronectin type 3 domain-containing protein
VVLQWDASSTSDVVGYNVYRSTVSGGPYTQLNSSVITDLNYIDENVQAGQTYYYVVTAIASDGVTESADSSEARATVPSP